MCRERQGGARGGGAGKLVDANRLLRELFVQDARPSLRWLRSQTKAKAIPHIRIGRLVFFDVGEVRRVLGNTGRGLGSRRRAAAVSEQ